MEKITRDFSKEASKEDRDSLAKEIRDRRRKHESVRSNYNELITNIERASETSFKKLVNFSRLAKLRKDMGIFKNDLQTAENDVKESKKMICDFYKKQAEKWKKLPFDKVDIERYFNPDFLKSLSLEEYKKVLERFGGGMVSHVTRQGVRDHADMGIMGHSGGEGKMHDGFKSIIKDGKLSYNLALSISELEGDMQIVNYLSLDNNDTKDTAIARLDSFTDEARQNAAGSFVDYHGPHFAVERVSDDFYGAETGNEIFFAFPSYMIAANYYHRNNPHVPIEATNYNDLWVYFKEDDEIDINSGLVFIPEDSQVDPDTGSVYETDENGEAKIDHYFLNRLRVIIQTPGFKDFAKDAADKLGRLIYSYKDYVNKVFGRKEEMEDATNTYRDLQEKLKSIVPDIDDKEMLFIFDYYFLRYDLNPENIEKTILDRMRDSRMLYIRAENTITSKQYWEDYFSKNPGMKPNKIVFYQGNNPTSALRQWKCTSTGLANKQVVDIDENRMLKNEHDLPEYVLNNIRSFRSRAYRVIDEYFDNNSTASINDMNN